MTLNTHAFKKNFLSVASGYKEISGVFFLFSFLVGNEYFWQLVSNHKNLGTNILELVFCNDKILTMSMIFMLSLNLTYSFY